jgi:metallo-beta-lactamase class B
MNVGIYYILIFFFALTVCACNTGKTELTHAEIVYQSENLTITQLSEHAFQHTSYLQTNDFGNVPCNGFILTSDNEAIIFDTPTNTKSSEELIQWITETKASKINAIIPTHFHNDCLGGLNTFHAKGIPSYAYFKTIALAKENNFEVPQQSFADSLIVNAGSEKVVVTFFGEGHTVDNVVGYFPGEQVLFGGCLIKEVDATKGYLGDANVAAWSPTVEKIKQAYPQVKIVVPGHGAPGDQKLLDYTIRLFRQEN